MDDPLQTTWADVHMNDTVLDATGKQWRVFSAPDRGRSASTSGPTQVTVGITDGERYVTMTKSSTETVLTVPAAVSDITDGAVATETPAQTQARQTGSTTYPDATSLSPLELRTHLYLVHDDMAAVTRVTTQDDMLQTHAGLHDDDPGHEHTEAT